MWITKVKINGSNSLIGNAIKKSGVEIYGYPISSRQISEGIYVYFIGFLSGDEKNKKNFILEIKKNPRTINIEREGDFIISQIKEPLRCIPGYNPHLVHIEPTIIKKDGTEYWTLGSWNRNYLMEFIDSLEKTHEAELLNITQKKITNFSLINVNPSLTLKQKEAMELAVKLGYYEYPRKIGIKQLCKIAKLSFSTFHAHLRKAEMKLLPFSLNKTS